MTRFRLTRRRVTKILHWTSFVLLMWFVAVPRSDMRAALIPYDRAMGAVLIAVSVAWFGLYLMRGPLGKPGPKLPGAARSFHIWSHRVLYLSLLALIWIGAVAIWRDMPGAAYQPYVVAVLIACTALHGLFNLWRHTALRDNALAVMVPRALHFLL